MSATSTRPGPQLPERWVHFYTRGLPPHVRHERRDEIASDVYEHCASSPDALDHGVRVAVVGRTLRGVPGDLMWRLEEGRAMRSERRAMSEQPTGMRAAWASVTQSWFTPIAALLGVFNLVAAVMVVGDPDGKMPGQVIGPLFLVGFAVAMFSGLWLRWRARSGMRIERERPSRSDSPDSIRRLTTPLLLGLAFVAIAFIILGMMVSPLPLVVGVAMLIVVLIASVRRWQVGVESSKSGPVDQSRSARGLVLADVLIVAGTLPAIGLWWMVVPPILALVVIGGVIGTQPGSRRQIAV